jgi:hypothetical protein
MQEIIHEHFCDFVQFITKSRKWIRKHSNILSLFTRDLVSFAALFVSACNNSAHMGLRLHKMVFRVTFIVNRLFKCTAVIMYATFGFIMIPAYCSRIANVTIKSKMKGSVTKEIARGPRQVIKNTLINNPIAC